MLTELAGQLNLLAQGPNLEDWSDVLILLVMAALWLAGALVKTMNSSRKGPQGQRNREGTAHQQGRPRETWQEKLTHKVQEIQRTMEAKARQVEQESQARAQARMPRSASGSDQPPAPPAGGITFRPGRKGDPVMVYDRRTPQPATERRHQAARQRQITKAVSAAGQLRTEPPAEPRVEIGRPGSEPVIEEMAGIVREPPMPLDLKSVHPAAAGQPTVFQPAAVIDYSDPDALKKAILHFEILGKPIALRDLSGENSSF